MRRHGARSSTSSTRSFVISQLSNNTKPSVQTNREVVETEKESLLFR